MTMPVRPDCFEFAMSFLGDPEEAELRSYIKALEARATLAQPEAVGPKDFELVRAIPDWWPSTDAPRYDLDDSNPEQPLFSVFQDDVVEYARAVLQRWGHPAITPIPVSERLPEAEDCDAEGRCWWHAPETDAKCAVWCLGPGPNCLPPEGFGETHWLPAHALPLPTTEP